jgi:hypothetical protein
MSDDPTVDDGLSLLQLVIKNVWHHKWLLVMVGTVLIATCGAR